MKALLSDLSVIKKEAMIEHKKTFLEIKLRNYDFRILIAFLIIMFLKTINERKIYDQKVKPSLMIGIYTLK